MIPSPSPATPAGGGRQRRGHGSRPGGQSRECRVVPCLESRLGRYAQQSAERPYPHYPDFAQDERAIGIGVRAMAGWIAGRTQRVQRLPGRSGARGD
ncbi:hypothetical protein [Streptomyces sp. CB02923]|uniref:hypothetical protein n=1 Tax=Streptomyces sp. CB02923 TaxID=1718985 RepID=UPI0009A1153D